MRATCEIILILLDLIIVKTFGKEAFETNLSPGSYLNITISKSLLAFVCLNVLALNSKIN
jgi:hypothetical protein